jgi:hypothetical protein
MDSNKVKTLKLKAHFLEGTNNKATAPIKGNKNKIVIIEKIRKILSFIANYQ